MIADDTEQIKRRIKEHLRTIPKYPTNCSICGRYAATFTQPTEIVHFDCYKNLLWIIMKQEKNKQALQRIHDSK